VLAVTESVNLVEINYVRACVACVFSKTLSENKTSAKIKLGGVVARAFFRIRW